VSLSVSHDFEYRQSDEQKFTCRDLYDDRMYLRIYTLKNAQNHYSAPRKISHWAASAHNPNKLSFSRFSVKFQVVESP